MAWVFRTKLVWLGAICAVSVGVFVSCLLLYGSTNRTLGSVHPVMFGTMVSGGHLEERFVRLLGHYNGWGHGSSIKTRFEYILPGLYWTFDEWSRYLCRSHSLLVVSAMHVGGIILMLYLHTRVSDRTLARQVALRTEHATLTY